VDGEYQISKENKSHLGSLIGLMDAPQVGQEAEDDR
jgi:hypothetical protein